MNDQEKTEFDPVHVQNVQDSARAVRKYMRAILVVALLAVLYSGTKEETLNISVMDVPVKALSLALFMPFTYMFVVEMATATLRRMKTAPIELQYYALKYFPWPETSGRIPGSAMPSLQLIGFPLIAQTSFILSTVGVSDWVDGFAFLLTPAFIFLMFGSGFVREFNEFRTGLHNHAVESRTKSIS